MSDSREDLATVLWSERVRAAQGDGAPAAASPAWTEPVTRDVARSRRKRGPRAKTLPAGAPVELGSTDGEGLPTRPHTRGECLTEERPCPFASCAHHLYLDVDPATGAIKLNFPDLEVWELPESCVLDVAERGGIPGSGQGDGVTLEDVATVMNFTRERARQVEVKGIAHLLRADRRHGRKLAQHAEDEGLGMRSRRRLPVLPPTPDEDDEDDDADLG